MMDSSIAKSSSFDCNMILLSANLYPISCLIVSFRRDVAKGSILGIFISIVLTRLTTMLGLASYFYLVVCSSLPCSFLTVFFSV